MADRNLWSVGVDMIDANPDQPRKHFDEAALRELAASIQAEGLMQPITVTPRAGRYMIVAGERRWRAHQIAGLKTIDCMIEKMDEATVMIRAIVENAIRRDVSPIEEAVAFQRCLDMGMTVDELAERLGMKQSWRITERTCLLTLRAEYQQLLRAGQLTHSQGFEMAQLSPAGQDRLFQKIRVGECKSYDALRAASLAIREEEAQLDLIGGETRMSEADARQIRAFEQRFARVAAILRASTVDNEVVAVRKVNPDKAGRLADLAAAMSTDLTRIAAALRSHAAPALV